ncbi:response regulator [Luteolibacter arcticus]|uniref:Response regulator n=1 Tax=Luteolibacter arcticus TaxID=1581411 RepID=A0ABT3GN32_9BACT|nr:response regulator [Luteolibacter arcticus]MCW1924912.1 response regulator [Luteolibacter arcticus]
MSPSPDITARRFKVLVVDDEPTLRLGFSYALADHDTETAAGGHEALVKIGEQQFDVVILDLRMPDIDGLQVIEMLRRQENPLPVVLCSAALTPSSALRAITGNVVDFLLKPVRPAELRGVIEHVLCPGEDLLSQALAKARAGHLNQAIHHLESVSEPCPRITVWTSVLRAIRLGGLEGEAAAFVKLEREGLDQLAFRVAE